MEFVTGSDEVSSPWEKLVGQAIYGSERFVEELQAYLRQEVQTKEIPKSQRFAGRPTLAELPSEAIFRNKPQRNDAIVKAHLEHGYTLKEIADEIGILPIGSYCFILDSSKSQLTTKSLTDLTDGGKLWVTLTGK